MLFAAGFLASFVIGGLNGVVTAVIPFDWQVHDTYFVVAHLHYVLVGANVFPVFAALLLLAAEDHRPDARTSALGKWSFALMFIGFNLTFFPMHIRGLLGHAAAHLHLSDRQRLGAAEPHGDHRRLHPDAPAFCQHLELRRQRCGAARSPARTRGTRTRSSGRPIRRRPCTAFERIPASLPHTRCGTSTTSGSIPVDDRVLDYGRVTPTTTAGNAAPRAVAKMADDTIMPLLVSVMLTVLFAALLTKLMWLALFAFVGAALGAGGWLWPEPERTPDGAAV